MLAARLEGGMVLLLGFSPSSTFPLSPRLPRPLNKGVPAPRTGS